MSYLIHTNLIFYFGFFDLLFEYIDIFYSYFVLFIRNIGRKPDTIYLS
jgi:hypothetical protein